MDDWQQRLRQIDPGWLVVILLCLGAAAPFIIRPDLPQATDAELHVFRLAELSRVIRSGELYPRWAPNFYYGYGYPVFNYYAPLVYYLGLPVELMPLLNAVDGVKAVFIASFLAGGIGLYGLLRAYWGRSAALLSVALFTFAPYIHFVDPHARGALAETFSIGLFPLALWMMDRLRQRPSPWRWLTAVLTVAAIILSHNLMAMIFFALLLAWAFWWLIIRRFLSPERPTTESAPYLLFLALLLGVGLAAFFWLPVALEQDAVNLSTVIGDGSHFDFRNHFLSWGELLAPPTLLDWGATEPVFTLSLGLAQWVLAGVGLLLLARYLLVKRLLASFSDGVFSDGVWTALFWLLVTPGLLFMMLSLSTFLWERLPFLPFLQFPWRLLGATTIGLAILAGAGFGLWLPRLSATLKTWLPASLIGLTILAGLPLSEVPPWPADFGPTSARRALEIELAGRWLGTTSTADFVPATVDVLPKPVQPLLEDIFQGRTLDRVNRVTLPEGATVVTDHVSPLHLRYQVDSPEWFLLRLFLFHFPGWQARIDGQPVETELGLPEGFLVVPVTAGEHVVEVEFGSTPARQLAWGVSLLALLGLVGMTWRVGRLFGGQAARDGWSGAKGQRPLLAIALVVTLILLLDHFLISPQGWLRYESTGFEAQPAERDLFVDLGGQIAIIGLDPPPTPVEAGDEVALTVYWKAQQDLEINYQSFVHLLHPDGSIVAQADKLNPGDFPTKRWPLDKYIRDPYILSLPPDLPPGEYRLSIGLWVAIEGWRLPRFDEQGQQVGDTYVWERPLIVR